MLKSAKRPNGRELLVAKSTQAENIGFRHARSRGPVAAAGVTPNLWPSATGAGRQLFIAVRFL
jgi:hypothetical protein